MSEEKVKRIRLNAEQARSLRAACGLEPGVSAVAARTRHLTDEEFIGYLRETFPEERGGPTAAHLAHCPACQDEMDRLSALAAAWKGEETRQRVMARLATLSAPVKTAEKHPLAAQRGVSLRSLLLPQGAYGEGGESEVAQLDFIVTDRGSVVEGLQGTLQRRHREYYARIQPSLSTDATRFKRRRVVLTIANPGEKRPLLQRTIDIGVTVLLGTDIRLTQQSVLQAELLSDAPAGETEGLAE